MGQGQRDLQSPPGTKPEIAKVPSHAGWQGSSLARIDGYVRRLSDRRSKLIEKVGATRPSSEKSSTQRVDPAGLDRSRKSPSTGLSMTVTKQRTVATHTARFQNAIHATSRHHLRSRAASRVCCAVDSAQTADDIGVRVSVDDVVQPKRVGLVKRNGQGV